MRKIKVPRVPKDKMFQFLDVVKFALILLLALMFINFNSKAAKQAEDTAKIAQSTNDVVRTQGDILEAIKQVTDDTRITAVEQTSIIICMLQVPIERRTTDLQSQCRNLAVASSDDNVAKTPGRPDDAPVHSSPQNTSPAKPAPSEKPQAPAPEPSIIDRILSPVNGLINSLGKVQ